MSQSLYRVASSAAARRQDGATVLEVGDKFSDGDRSKQKFFLIPTFWPVGRENIA